MPELKNARHEQFCLEYIKDRIGSAAYKRAGYRATGNSAEVNAAQLLRNAQVMARIAELNSGITSNAIVTAQERREALSRIIRGEEHDIPSSVRGKRLSPPTISERIKAIELLSKLEGDFVVRTENSGVPQSVTLIVDPEDARAAERLGLVKTTPKT
jgi:Terminase small subunit